MPCNKKGVHIPYYVPVDDHGSDKYQLMENVQYHSKRYGKDVYIPVGRYSDGATGAFDINSLSWWVHDELCRTGRWSDGSFVNNWQASTVLSDILKSEGRWARARYWFITTWTLGCKKARQNGMW